MFTKLDYNALIPTSSLCDFKFKELDSLLDSAYTKIDTSIKNLIPNKIVRTENGSIINYELPHIDKDTIDIKVEDRYLKVSAKKMSYDPADKEKYTYTYNFSCKLNDDIDIENINAEYINGVLKIHLSNKEKEIKKIEVKCR